MDRAIASVALVLACLTLAPILTVAAQGNAALPAGNIYVPPEGLEVRAGETLHVGPGTKVSGDGPVNVYGRLNVKGAAHDTANFTVPIVVFPGGRADLEHAHVWSINTTALEARSAQILLQNVLFEGNNRALQASGTSEVIARDSTFRHHAGEAFYVEERATVVLENDLFTANGRGMTIYSTARSTVNDSTFLGNGQHLVVDLYPGSESGAIEISRNFFGAPASAPTQPPGILLRDARAVVEGSLQRTITLNSNRIENAPKGLSVQGGALVVESRNDSFTDNGIGILVDGATLRVVEGTFGNEQDIAGSGHVTLDRITYLRASTVDVTPASANAPTTTNVPWMLAAAGVAAAVGAVVLVRMRRPARSPMPTEAPVLLTPKPLPPATPAPPAPPRALDPPLTSVERRILEDVLANPGTAQRAVADRVGMTRQALHYHVKKLEARGLISKTVDGRETRCTVPGAVAELLGPQGATRTESHEKA